MQQDKREARDTVRDQFDLFGGFGSFRGFSDSIFGRSLFDDPFFTHPFGNLPSQRNQRISEPRIHNSKRPVIQELDSDDDGGDVRLEDEGEEKGQKSSTSNKEPFVDHPDDDDDDETRENDRNQIVNSSEDQNKAQRFKYRTCRVSYGGVDGTYYSSEATRRMGSDGVMLEECKEADSVTGEAKHRISRGIHDKGHSLTRKLKSDGNVDTLQTLHNLNEDELGSFEEAWKDNSRKHLPGWNSPPGYHRNTGGGGSEHMDSSNWDRLLLPPSFGTGRHNSRTTAAANSSSGGQAKKVVRINIE